MADKYYRLVSLIVNICPLPLRELFHRCAQNDPMFTAPYSAHSYMLFRQNDVLAARNIRRDQYDKIYPQNGQTDISDWDITLLATTLKLLFVNEISQISDNILSNMDIIRDLRNNIQHIASASSMSDADFIKQWSDIEAATLDLASDVKGQAYKENIQSDIDKAKTSNMPDLGNVLCRWFEEKTLSLDNKIDELCTEMTELREKHQKETEELKERLSNVAENTSRTKSMIYKGSRKQTDNSDKFTATMMCSLPSDFSEPPEVLEITEKLSEVHRVVVCGNSNSSYLQAALKSIKNIEYAGDRCMALTSAKDWWHIGSDEVDCTLIINPFGKITFDRQKALKMSELFDNMLYAVDNEEEYEFFDVVIVTEKALLHECQKWFPHKLLEDAVTVCAPSAEEDLIKGYSSILSSENGDDTYGTVKTKDWKFVKNISVKSDNEADCFMPNICMLPPNQLAVLEQSSNSLKLVNISEERIIARETFPSFPRSPIAVQQYGLAVLLTAERMIQLFSLLYGLKKERQIKLNGECNSILFKNDTFFAFFISPVRVQVLNLKGEEMNTILLDANIQRMNINPVYTAISPQNNLLYISDWTNNLLLRVDMAGKTLTLSKDCSFNRPNGIFVTSDESVYICNKENHTVLQMKADFTQQRVVLGRSDGIVGPVAICFGTDENVMFITSSFSDPTYRFYVKMFSLI